MTRYRIVQYGSLPRYEIQERRWFLCCIPMWIGTNYYPYDGTPPWDRVIGRLNTREDADRALARCQQIAADTRGGWQPVKGSPSKETRATTPLFDTWLDRLLFWALWVLVANLLLMEAYATYHMLYG